MTKTWIKVSADIATIAALPGHGGFQTRSTVCGELNGIKFYDHEILATNDDVERLYDWATAADEHISCPTI